MAVIGNLRIPWTTAKAQDNNFDVSRDQLTDPGNQIEVLDNAGQPATNVDWSTITFSNLVSINGILISDFLININDENIGDLLDVDPTVTSGATEGDIIFRDGSIWNRLPRGSDGQFLRATTTGITWGTGTAQINDFSDGLFRIFSAGDAGKIIAFDASLITSGNTRTFQLPDGDGVLARIADIPVVGSSFSDTAFNVFNDADTTTKVEFQISGLTPGVTRTATWPDKDGVVAFLSDITSPGNTFSDALFRIFDSGDITRQLAWELDSMTTGTTTTIRLNSTANKEFGIPDASNLDEFLMETFPQTVQNKTIDNTNVIDDGALSINVVLETIVNTWGAGLLQSFEHDATNAGFRLVPAVGSPSVQNDGELWYNSSTQQILGRINGADVDMGSVTPQDSSFTFVASDESTDLDTLNNPKIKWRIAMPFTLNTGVGLGLGVRADVSTAPVGADIIVDIKQNGVSILSAPLHIDDGDDTSVGSATVITLVTSVLTDNAQISAEVLQVGSGTAGAGLKISLIGQS